MINCVVIDDEPLAREGITNYINQVEFLQLVGQGSNPIELNTILKDQKVDLIFLDIQMPIINGIDFLKITPNLPMIILTTAYPSYALEGYDLDVLDYLLKPITFNRFLKAVNKANNAFLLKSSTGHTELINQVTDDYFFVKCDNKFEKIYFGDILYIQALQNYVCIFTSARKYITLLTIKYVESKLINENFIRVHKSYIVSKSKIESIESHELVINGKKIPISRNYRKDTKDLVLGNKLWAKNSN